MYCQVSHPQENWIITSCRICLKHIGTFLYWEVSLSISVWLMPLHLIFQSSCHFPFLQERQDGIDTFSQCCRQMLFYPIIINIIPELLSVPVCWSCCLKGMTCSILCIQYSVNTKGFFFFLIYSFCIERDRKNKTECSKKKQSTKERKRGTFF